MARKTNSGLTETQPLLQRRTKYDAFFERVQFLDFEASGLGETSFPIEVAWSTREGLVRSVRIRPTDEWLTDGEWDLCAEALHGLTVDELQRATPVHGVAAELNAQLRGAVVFVDALPYDGFWLSRLYAAVGRMPPFKLANAVELIELAWRAAGGHARASFELLYQYARRRHPQLREHRAADDVRVLQATLEIARSGLDPARP